MKSKLWIPALLAATTFSASAFAHGGDRDNWRDDQWREHRHHHHHAYMPPPPPPAYWRYEAPYSYRDGHDYRYERSYYERPAARVELPILLPPSPHEVRRAIRDSLFGH
jgi:hypothetical protein